MHNAEFDKRFAELFTDMVEIAFEYVGRNKAEVDNVYVYVSMEKGILFYNVFYRINGQLVEMHRVNTVSKEQYDLSDERTFGLLDLGIEDARQAEGLFRTTGREVPTEMKMVYSPKTGAFDNQLSYELRYSNDPVKSPARVFDDWFVELGGKLS